MMRRLAFVLCWLGAGASSAAQTPRPLPGTAPLTMEGDITYTMLGGVDRFLLRLGDESPRTRERHWHRDYSSHEAYVESVAENRERFRRYIGVVEPQRPFDALEVVATLVTPSLVAETDRLRIHAVRWPAFAKVHGEGLLLEPKRTLVAQVVALPDADWTPEMLAGLSVDSPPSNSASSAALNSCPRILYCRQPPIRTYEACVAARSSR